MQALAAMAERRPLRALYNLCDSQKQVSTGKLREYLDHAGDTLAGYAATLRHEFDRIAIADPAAPADLPECGCCGRTGECDADCDARLAAPAVQAVQYSSYSTSPGESVAGIALRQLGEESRWIEIRDLNAHAFPDVGPHDYYPAGTKLVMPKTAPPAHPDASVLVEALEQFADDSNWCYDTCDISRDVAKRSLAAYRAALAGKEGAQ